MNESFSQLSGWSAVANGALSIAILVTLALYFTVGGFWGTVNDSISVFWALSFLLPLMALYRLNPSDKEAVNLIPALGGIVAMVSFAVLQALLVAGLVRFEQTFLAVITLGALLGLALAVFGLMARPGQLLPSGLTWLMVVFGLSYIISAAGFWLGGWENPLAALGYLVGALTGPVWAIWLGRLLLDGRLATVAMAGPAAAA